MNNLAIFGERRRAGDRRCGPDRRRSPIDQRLRKGLWFALYRATEWEKFQKISRHARDKIQAALLPEVLKYVYFDRTTGMTADPRDVLISAIVDVWNKITTPEVVPIHAVEAVADAMLRANEVISRDRRTNADRRSGNCDGNVTA